MGNTPINAIDPDGGDIIFLNATKSVMEIGHAAILIGNDKDGWRYVSKNGTTKNWAGRFGLYGESIDPDLGNRGIDEENPNDFRGTGLTAKEVINIINRHYYDEHNTPENPEANEWYDRYVRIASTKEQDEKAYNAAVLQARAKYGVFGASCLDIPQDGLLNTGIKFKRAGDWNIFPNSWFTNFAFYNFGSFNAAPRPTRITNISIKPGTFTFPE